VPGAPGRNQRLDLDYRSIDRLKLDAQTLGTIVESKSGSWFDQLKLLASPSPH
jgi:hypothetical protein